MSSIYFPTIFLSPSEPQILIEPVFFFAGGRADIEDADFTLSSILFLMN